MRCEGTSTWILRRQIATRSNPHAPSPRARPRTPPYVPRSNDAWYSSISTKYKRLACVVHRVLVYRSNDDGGQKLKSTNAGFHQFAVHYRDYQFAPISTKLPKPTCCLRRAQTHPRHHQGNNQTQQLNLYFATVGKTPDFIGKARGDPVGQGPRLTVDFLRDKSQRGRHQIGFPF